MVTLLGVRKLKKIDQSALSQKNIFWESFKFWGYFLILDSFWILGGLLLIFGIRMVTLWGVRKL